MIFLISGYLNHQCLNHVHLLVPRKTYMSLMRVYQSIGLCQAMPESRKKRCMQIFVCNRPYGFAESIEEMGVFHHPVKQCGVMPFVRARFEFDLKSFVFLFLFNYVFAHTCMVGGMSAYYVPRIFSSAWLCQQSSWNLNLSVVCRPSVVRCPSSVRPCRNYLWT